MISTNIFFSNWSTDNDNTHDKEIGDDYMCNQQNLVSVWSSIW